jgi:hypothetical protein
MAFDVAVGSLVTDKVEPGTLPDAADPRGLSVS